MNTRARLVAIDAVRGAVIALMVLDHTRDFIASGAVSPTDLEHTTPALFFTRWITHYCASAFVLLAGVSARIYGARSSGGALSAFLLKRGLWLIVLEFTVVNFVWHFNLSYSMGLVMQVIWAIGASMCALAGFCRVPLWLSTLIGASLVVGHNLLDGIAPERFGALAPLWNVLHVEGQVPFGLVIYPLMPWLGTMLLGYALGGLYLADEATRKRWLTRAGSGAVLAFVLVRGLDRYGDPAPWHARDTLVGSAMSFLNVTKYPPSLAYLLMTLGPILLALRVFEARTDVFTAALARVGRVPLFAYVLHLALVHTLAGAMGVLGGQGTAMFTQIFVSYPASWGYPLHVVYLAWFGVLCTLYPASVWFGRIKERHPGGLLAYL